ncbi:unnamed protein product [Linum trigynum]|uniref:Reverse transcriptase zinc-binding domain-containing protein n=1 Tax=Linum trigynum TaxID=586398 RepID=A0AAV2FP24_9ROSI
MFNPGVLSDSVELKVADFICSTRGRWELNKIGEWFPPEVCRAIRSIPLPRRAMENRLVWHATGDEVFSAKSAYHLAVRLDQEAGGWRHTVSWMDRGNWKRVWNLTIPPKLKVFLWQVLHRFLPTTEALIGRKVALHPRCPICWNALETMEHLFFDCCVARALWDAAGLEHVGQGLPRLTFPLFMKRLLAIVTDPPQVMAVVAVLWRIWKSRNWVVFDGKQFGILSLLRQYHQQLREWTSLPRDVVAGAQAGVTPLGSSARQASLICRWDDAVQRGSHSAGGMVMLGLDGVVVGAIGVCFPGIDDPLLVELLALRKAILWCRSGGLLLVRFEGDAKVVVDRLNQAQGSDSTLGVIFREVLLYLAESDGFSVWFVGRRSNRVAHLVARNALSLYPIASRSFDFVAWLRHVM